MGNDNANTDAAALARIEANTVHTAKTVDERTTVIFKKIDKLQDSISGDNGLNIRVDRIEQREKSRGRLLWAAITATIGGWVSLIAKKFGA